MNLYESYIEVLKESDKVEEKINDYIDYIAQHKENVEKAWEVIKTIDNPYIKDNLEEIERNVKHHDESKYDDTEFEWYRRKYFPVDDEEANSVMENINDVFKLHYSRNPHHWEYWLDKNDELDWRKHSSDDIDNDIMIAYIEMLADWASFGMKSNTPEEVREWYISNKPKIKLWPKEQEELEKILKEYVNKVKEE